MERAPPPAQSRAPVTTPTVIVHGGAGAWTLGSTRLARAEASCRAAAAAGLDAVSRGGSAVDAVEAAVRALEDDPIFNAGRGSHPTSAGTVELDAMIMDGRDLALGAVAAVQRILHAVTLARAVMDRTPHTLLAAAGAEAFADSIGFPRTANEDLLPPGDDAAAHDTVGAVALDARGNVAAATSTGGIPNKMPGRIGDSPLVGSGAYADNASAAVSATGDGEALMKLVISKTVCDRIAAGTPPRIACADALLALEKTLRAHGGLIALTPDGVFGVACNTVAMPWARAVVGHAIAVRAPTPRLTAAMLPLQSRLPIMPGRPTCGPPEAPCTGV